MAGQAGGMEVEEDDLERRKQQQPRYGCFPLRCFACCPSSVAAFIPRTWQNIQDWTHLSLVFGVVASILLVGDTILYIVSKKRCKSTLCVKEALAFIFIVPCCLYFVKIIGQYDDRLQSKQRDAKEQKEQLTKAYNNLLSDMDGLLTKSAESSAGLAERSFESKRRDFQRFLERAKSRYSVLYNGSKVENEQLLQHFRRFVVNWLRVFEECSIDPIQVPKRVVTMEELTKCLTVAEVADLTLERLRVTEVRFISIQRDQDAQMIRKNRNEYRRLTAAPDARQLAALKNGESFTNRTLTTELAPGSGSSRMTWLSVGRGSCGCRCNSSQTPDGFPKEIGFGCGRVVVLSREHGMLLAGFLVGWLIILLEILHVEQSKISALVIIEVVLNEICLAVLLARFEEIDVIQQLEREVRELKKSEQNVRQQQEKMHEFWSNAQQLTELWLYRTVPRLDLYKEVHSHLEDAASEDLNNWLEMANKQLEAIDKNLGELVNWRNEGALSLDAKKNFGKTINQLCQEQEFEQINRRLEEVSRSGMKCLEAPTQAAPPSDSKFGGMAMGIVNSMRPGK